MKLLLFLQPEIFWRGYCSGSPPDFSHYQTHVRARRWPRLYGTRPVVCLGSCTLGHMTSSSQAKLRVRVRVGWLVSSSIYRSFFHSDT